MIMMKSLARTLAFMGAVGAFALGACQTSRPPASAAKGPLIQPAPRCADFTQTIYFEAGEAALTRPAESLITTAAAKARGCAVRGVAIVGLADAPGDSGANLALSQKRAEVVKAALHRRGFDTVEIQVAAVGDRGAQTQAGQTKPVRRRADVTFHLAAPPSR